MERGRAARACLQENENGKENDMENKGENEVLKGQGTGSGVELKELCWEVFPPCSGPSRRARPGARKGST